jgi:hypothetical protein
MSNFKDVTNMITTVDLRLQAGDDGKPMWHFIYASQLYGTLFALYGKFNTAPAADGSCTLQSVEIRLFNYHGVINMGFVAVNPTAYEEPLNKKPRVVFCVQGTSSFLAPPAVNFPATYVFKPGDRKVITFDRCLYPLPGFAPVMGTANRNTTTPIQGGPPDGGLFDTEFQARSGDDYFNNPLRYGMYGCIEPEKTSGQENQSDTKKSKTESSEDMSLRWIASLRCTQSIVNLVY